MAACHFQVLAGVQLGLWDDQASDLMGQLAIAHVDPARSDPSLLSKIPHGFQNTLEEEVSNPSAKKRARHHQLRLLEVAGQVQEDADGLSYWVDESDPSLPPEEKLGNPDWQGIRKDVGIFTDEQFEFLMSKCLRSLNVPVGGAVASQNSMSVTVADTKASKKILDAKKPIDRVQSLAETIVFSISEDALPLISEGTGTATGTGTPSGVATPLGKGAVGKVKDSLAAVGRKEELHRRYLAGSKALDHLSKLLTSCETVSIIPLFFNSTPIEPTLIVR